MGEEREKEKEVFKRAEHAWGGGGSGNLIYQLVNFFFLTFRPRKTKHEDSHFRSFTGKIARNYSLCCRGSGLWKNCKNLQSESFRGWSWEWWLWASARSQVLQDVSCC